MGEILLDSLLTKLDKVQNKQADEVVKDYYDRIVNALNETVDEGGYRLKLSYSDFKELYSNSFISGIVTDRIKEKLDIGHIKLRENKESRDEIIYYIDLLMDKMDREATKN